MSKLGEGLTSPEVMGFIMRDIPDGLKLSGGATKIVDQAARAGMPYDTIKRTVDLAAKSAQSDGRNKIGPFGAAGREFDSLRQNTARTLARGKFVRI